MRGLLTGNELPPHKGRGRPKQFYNEDARVAWHALARFSSLFARLVRDPGFTPEAESTLRGHLMSLSNYFNTNTNAEAIAKKKKKAAEVAARRKTPRKDNPAPPVMVVHGTLHVDEAGTRHALCGDIDRRRVPNPCGGSLRIPDRDVVAMLDADVTCERCRQVIDYTRRDDLV